MFYPPISADTPLPFWRRGTAFSFIALAHALALLAAFGMAIRPEPAKPLQALTVRMLEPPPAPAPPEKTKPLPRTAAPRPSVVPPPVFAAAPTAAAAPVFAIAPQPEPRTVDTPAAPLPPPAPVIAARFDADYLQNPKPVYPPLSRRFGEEGKVVLRVRVSAQGTALAVDIRQSSGHARLDDAARMAVEKWRFVPARQGTEAVESSVLVPLTFALEH